MKALKRWGRTGFARALVGTGIGSVLVHSRASPPAVLAYHRIIDSGSVAATVSYDDLHVSPEHFARQLALLDRQCRVITPEQFLRERTRRTRGKPRVLITFDDGWADNYTNALPALGGFGMSALFFVAVNCVRTGDLYWTHKLLIGLRRYPGETAELLLRHDRTLAEPLKAPTSTEQCFGIFRTLNRLDKAKRSRTIDDIASAYQTWQPATERRRHFLSWDQLSTMKAKGMGIGAHTMSHDPVTIHSAAEVMREMGDSKAALHQQLGVPVETMAFPHGRYNAQAVRAAEESGYRVAFTGPNLARAHHRRSGFSLYPRRTVVPRIFTKLNGQYSPSLFYCWVTNVFTQPVPRQQTV